MPPTAPDSRLGKRYIGDEGLDLVSLPEVGGGAAHAPPGERSVSLMPLHNPQADFSSW